ncbi:hypothetical protein GCM10027059_30300 [Myceligenerans halotolerans]
MDAFLAQLPTIVGVVIGVVGTLATTAVTDAARWRREQRVRFDKQVLDVSAEYVASIREIVQTLASMTVHLRQGDKSPPLDADEGYTRLQAANHRRMLAWESLCLIADDDTVATGGRMWHVSANLEYKIRDLDAFDPADWEPLDREIRNQQKRFYQAVRRSLGIGPLAVPVSRYEHPPETD